MNDSRIAFIGAGNMANSLILGLIAKGVPASNLTACDIDQTRLATLRQECGIRTGSMEELAADADVLVLAVKPQVLAGVCATLGSLLDSRLNSRLKSQSPLIISIAAGIPLSSLEQWLGPQQAIVRCMPNTPALVLEGATGLFANTNTKVTQKQLAEDILSAVGICRWLGSEHDINAVTALSGSGPAYYFLLMEAMEQTAVSMGLEPEMARALTIQTALGAARLAASSDVGPEELRRRVTSPGGTTQAAIESFESEGFRDLVSRALTAARKRSIELAG